MKNTKRFRHNLRLLRFLDARTRWINWDAKRNWDALTPEQIMQGFEDFLTGLPKFSEVLSEDAVGAVVRAMPPEVEVLSAEQDGRKVFMEVRMPRDMAERMGLLEE